MKREELLEKLHEVTFAAFLTDLVTEECIEAITMTARGTNCRWMGYDEWKVYEIRPCGSGTWTEIREKIRGGVLTASDLKGTDLGRVLKDAAEEAADVDCSRFFSGLLELPGECPGVLYCYCASEEEPLSFFTDQEQLAKALAEAFSEVDTTWEEMETEDLQDWLDQYEEEGKEIPCIGFDEDAPDDAGEADGSGSAEDGGIRRYFIEEVKCGVTAGGMACGPVPGNVVASVRYTFGRVENWFTMIETDGIPTVFVTEEDVFEEILKDDFDEEFEEYLEYHEIDLLNGIQLNGGYEVMIDTIMEKPESPAAPLIKYMMALVRCETGAVPGLIRMAEGHYVDELEIPVSDVEEEYLESLEEED